MFKKLFSYVKDLFKSDAQIIAESQAGAAVSEEVKESSVVTDATVVEQIKEIEERMVEVAKDEKSVTAKDIKSKVKKQPKPKAEKSIEKSVGTEKSLEKDAPAKRKRKPAAKKPKSE
jgi:hypothetical protein